MKTANYEHFHAIKPFNLMVSYIELHSESSENVYDSHIHEECEIYINLSGDVSFVVENHIYPLKPGDIIITRPYEYHHCVYHSNKLHKHFWVLFSSSGNEHLFDIFYKRELGEANHLTLPPNEADALVSLCREMTEKKRNENEKYYYFFKLIHILQNAEVAAGTEGNYPSDITSAIYYINRHFTESIFIGDIAREAKVSINTLERHFRQFLNVSPLAYIRKKRLANATKLLSEGYNVAEASEQSGFSDYSNFISLFKKTYGITPLKYKKRLETK